MNDSLGVYKAKIGFKEPNTGKLLTKRSTMFPDFWSADRIKVEVNEAYKTRKIIIERGREIWIGTTPSGVNVKGYLEPTVTVYPLMKE
ncbi:TPA: EndoU domain-containing protein [Pasteurella multocida]|nr:EndoU domain-containing protein [Pasteurella multocida]